ncbi:MAG: DNA translocase FtsK [Dehalococcoidia bacterium]
MARTRARLSRGLDTNYYARGPTGEGLDLAGLMATSPAFRWTISGLLILAILVPPIVIFWDTLLETFGIAMGPVGAAIPIALFIAYRYPQSLIFRANRWLALVAFGALLFGALAFFQSNEGILANATFGGSVGTSIIGDQDALGVLRLIGIGLATVALFVPVFSWRASITGAILLIGATALTARILRVAYVQQRELRARRQVRKWLDELAAPPRERSMVEDRFFEKNLAAALEGGASPGGIGILEPPGTAPDVLDEGAPVAEAAQEDEVEKEPRPRRPWNMLPGSRMDPDSSGWMLPPIDLLDSTTEVELKPADHQVRAALIEEALASHGIEAKVVQINPGPTVTQFGVEPGWFRKFKEIRERDKDGNPISRVEEVSRRRVKVDQIAALDKDLAMALAAPSIRIEAPVPGKSLVGIEVPNSSMGLVGLREAIESPEFQRLHAKTNLALTLGQGSAGEVIVDPLGRMPHALIAGATGSGKSVCITSLICCLLMHNTPDDLRLVLIDPKRVELVSFGTLPHLITPIIVDVERVVGVLKWISQEMDSRYKAMASVSARNIEGHNKKVGAKNRLPYLVVVIDELADLMSVAPYEVEQALTRVAQMGRATGIHLIVATQRPSVDVITGLIKANFPTRISFAVTSMMDSRVILDTMGAEKLLGRGDMLYLPSDASKPRRLQGVFASEQEVERIVYFWGNQKGATQAAKSLGEFRIPSTPVEERRDEDPYLTKARDLAMRHNSISTSLLQRRLGIGYPRAARLIDQLEEEEVVGLGEPGKSRKVLKRRSAKEEDGG